MKLDRTTAPRSGTFAKTSFPKYETFSVGGIPVYLIENHNQPYVGVLAYFRTGATQDAEATQGLASFVAEMMTKGTATRTAPEIAEAIDFVGGSLGASAGWDATTVSVSLLKKHLGLGVELMTDVLRNATFSDEELSRAKMQRLASIQHAKSDAGYLADTLFTKIHFEGHPYSLEALGTQESVPALTSALLKERYSKYISPTNAFLVASGDITPSEFTELFSECLDGWSSGETEPIISPPTNNISSTRIALIKKDEAVQSAIRLGHTGIHRGHPDYIPATVMNVILGGYFNSRINQNLREKNGFTYGARSYFDTRKQTGAFVVSTEVRTEVTRRSVEEILYEMKKLRTEGVTEDELVMVKNYIVGSFPLSLETPQQMAGRLASIPLFGLDSDYYDTYIETVRSLTKEDINRTAQTYLKPDVVLLSVSGNADILQDELAGLGEITLYDNNYRKIH